MKHAGDRAIADEIKNSRRRSRSHVASRGYSIYQPLASRHGDIPNTFTDIAASTLLANLCTDAFRNANESGHRVYRQWHDALRFTRGKSGVLTVYDVFAVAPGRWCGDTTAGSTLVTGLYSTVRNSSICWNSCWWIIRRIPARISPALPAEVRYDLSRPHFDVVTAIRMGDSIALQGNRHHREGGGLYSLTCPLFRHDCRRHTEIHQGQTDSCSQEQGRAAAHIEGRSLVDPRSGTPDLLPPAVDRSGQHRHRAERGAVREIKEWQAIMDHLRSLP